MTKYLTIFTIGPVQGFIAAARKLQDLYAGSFLLSYLSKQTMRKAQELGADILFPDPSIEGAPNRFIMTVEAEDTGKLKTLCAELEAFVRGEWERIAQKVIAETGFGYAPAVERQIRSLIQVFYASEPYASGAAFGDCYIGAIKRLGAAKTQRNFAQLDEPAGRKCDLSYEQNALFYREHRPYIVPDAQQVIGRQAKLSDINKYMPVGEALSAVSFVKRCLDYAGLEGFKGDSFPSVTDIYEMNGAKLKGKGEEGGYYAVVMFDGDNMGKWYSEPHKHGVAKEKTEAFQAFLSREISGFAERHSHSIIDWAGRKNGVVIYAGGEDFLGALNLRDFLSALRELRETFGNIDLSGDSDFTKERLTFSAGIVIAHVKTPLNTVLDAARDAEHKAKALSDKKDAFCLRIMKHSGETNEFTLPFYHDGVSTLALIDGLANTICRENVSVKFIYQLGEELERIAETKSEFLKDILLAETERLLKHSDIKDAAAADSILGKIKLLAEHTAFSLSNLLMFLRAIAFIARERGAV